jgi:hypothetical protein
MNDIEKGTQVLETSMRDSVATTGGAYPTMMAYRDGRKVGLFMPSRNEHSHRMFQSMTLFAISVGADEVTVSADVAFRDLTEEQGFQTQEDVDDAVMEGRLRAPVDDPEASQGIMTMRVKAGMVVSMRLIEYKRHDDGSFTFTEPVERVTSSEMDIDTAGPAYEGLAAATRLCARDGVVSDNHLRDITLMLLAADGCHFNIYGPARDEIRIIREGTTPGVEEA